MNYHVSTNEISPLNLLKQNGGFSINMNMECVSPQNGYAVSLTDNKVILENDDYNDNFKIKSAIKDIWNFLRLLNIPDKSKLIIGGWVDNGIVYIDASMYVDNMFEAFTIGKIFRQKAIYDFKNEISLQIKK